MSNDLNCILIELFGIDDIEICSLVLEDLIRKIVEKFDKENFDLNLESSGGVVGFVVCCKVCVNLENLCYCFDVSIEFCKFLENFCYVQVNEFFINRDYCFVEYDLGMEKVDFF